MRPGARLRVSPDRVAVRVPHGGGFPGGAGGGAAPHGARRGRAFGGGAGAAAARGAYGAVYFPGGRRSGRGRVGGRRAGRFAAACGRARRTGCRSRAASGSWPTLWCLPGTVLWGGSLAPATGELVAAAALDGGSEAWEALRPNRFRKD